MPRNLFAELDATRPQTGPRNLFKALDAQQAITNPYDGKSTDELLVLSESGTLSPEQQNQVTDTISRNEQAAAPTDRQVAESPDLLRQRFKEKTVTRNAAQAAGFRSGLKNFGQGALQLGGELVDAVPGVDVDTEAFTQGVNLERADRKAELEKRFPKDPLSVKAGEILGEGAPLSAVPGKSIQTFGQLIKAGAKLGALAGATQFDEQGGSVERVKNTATGAAVGAVFSAALGGAAATGSRILNALQGKLAKGEDVIKFGKEVGVDVFTPDVAQSPLLNRVENAISSFGPVGTTGARLNQNSQAKNAAEKFLNELKPRSDDVPALIQESINNTINANETIKHGLFARLTRDTEQFGPVSLTKSKQVAQNIIDEQLARGPRADKGLIEEMQKIIDVEDIGFGAAQLERSELFKDATRAKKGMLSTTTESRPFEMVAGAMSDDMRTYAKANNVEDQFNEANQFFRDVIVPLRDRQIQKAAQTDSPDELLNTFIQARKFGGADRAKKLFNALDDGGKDAVRFSIVERAYNNALKQTDNGEIFSPSLFAGELEKLQKSTDVFFAGEQKRMLDGFKKLMRAVQKSGSIAADPPTGNRLFLPLFVMQTSISPPTGAGVAAGSTLARVLMTSEAGKRILLSASTAQPGSPNMRALTRMLTILTEQQTAN